MEKLAELPSLGRGGGKGMHYRGVLLKTDQGSLMVDLAPAWYLNEKKFVVKVGDTVSATGSKGILNNEPGLIAREVTVNGTTLKLRDDQGIPMWHAGAPAAGMGKGVRSGGGPGRGSATPVAGSGPARGDPRAIFVPGAIFTVSR